MDNAFDVYKCEREICKQLKIQDVALDLLGSPVSATHDKTKWNIKYKTFYKTEKTASFLISESFQIFHCFSTGHHGNLVTLYKDYNKLPDSESACKELIEKYGLNLDFEMIKKSIYFSDEENDLITFYNWVVKLGHYNLSTKTGLKAKEYLENRNISKEGIDLFNLGYIEEQKYIDEIVETQCHHLNKQILQDLHVYDSNGKFQLLNRIIIPIYDKDSNIVSLVGRNISSNSDLRYKELSINDEYQSLYPSFTPKKHLYNFNNAKHYVPVDNELFIVEGCFDVIRLNLIGVRNVVGILTTTMTKEQLSILKEIQPNKLVVLLDGDNSGITQQEELLYKLSSIKNKSQFIYRNTFFIEEDNYISRSEDPDSYFNGKNLGDWTEFNKHKKDFRSEYIEKYIKKYKSEPSFLIEDLFEEVGDFINLRSTSFIDNLKKIVENEKQGDIEKFNQLFKYNDNIQSLYLMDKLNAEQYYCMNLLEKSRDFVNEFRSYNKFMNEVYDLLDDSSNKQIKFYQSIENRKLYGDKSSKLVIDVFDCNEIKLYTFELDYLQDTFYMLRRFSKSMTGDKRNENNFFDAQVVFGILDRENQKKALENIAKEIGGTIKDD